MRAFLRFLCISVWVFATSAAFACTICAPADRKVTLTYSLSLADAIMLAQPISGDSALGVIDIRNGTLRSAVPLLAPLAVTERSLDPEVSSLLLVRYRGTAQWRNLGALSRANADWVRQWSALALEEAKTDTDVMARARFFAKALENPDALIAQVAYEEVASVPYRLLRTIAKDIPPQLAAARTKDAALRPRFPLYYLLHGLTGDAGATSALQANAATADPARSRAEMAALLAAIVELDPQAGLDYLERSFLGSLATADEDLQAAFMALQVHADVGGRLRVEEVVKAYAKFIQANPQRSGWVANELATWGRWEFADRYAHIIRNTPDIRFASKYPIVLYLLRNPLPQAKAHLDSLRAEGFY